MKPRTLKQIETEYRIQHGKQAPIFDDLWAEEQKAPRLTKEDRLVIRAIWQQEQNLARAYKEFKTARFQAFIAGLTSK